jgi:hypothetical protein
VRDDYKGFDALDEDARIEFLATLLDEDTPNITWIAREHKELLRAVWDDHEEIMGPDGTPISPRLHLTLHGIVEKQYDSGDPPVVEEIVNRLMADNWPRHEAVHLVCAANIDELFLLLDDQDNFNTERFTLRVRTLVAESQPPIPARRLKPRPARVVQASRKF